MREMPPRASLWRTIFSATSSGLPIMSAPSGPIWASKSRRVMGRQPRSLPMSLMALAKPGKYSSAASFVVADLQQQLELLGEQRVVVVEVEAEQRKRLDRRSAAHDHLGAAAR